MDPSNPLVLTLPANLLSYLRVPLKSQFQSPGGKMPTSDSSDSSKKDDHWWEPGHRTYINKSQHEATELLRRVLSNIGQVPVVLLHTKTSPKEKYHWFS